MENLTIKQLKAVCDQKGINYTSKEKKADLIAKLKGSATEAESGDSFNGEY